MDERENKTEYPQGRFDISGRRFGALTAIQAVSGKNSAARWLCRCDCGGEKEASYHDLTQGLVKSCGCLRSDRRAKDISGQRFGLLTAIEYTGRVKNGSRLWRCRCDCGNYREFSLNSLQRGAASSCGCTKGDDKARDVSGLRFGRLVALEYTGETKNGSRVWLCKCDCGNYKKVRYRDLAQGSVKSCGCLRGKTIQKAP